MSIIEFGTPIVSSHVDYLESPIGLVEIGGNAQAINSLHFVDALRYTANPNHIVARATQQLTEYMNGLRHEFDLPLAMQGTAFQRAVWQHLLAIPYGRTTSYQEVARAIGRPRAIRAVGAANGRNPISIIVPCHRVVGSNGQLTGYGGGLWRKKWLLEHEARLAGGRSP